MSVAVRNKFPGQEMELHTCHGIKYADFLREVAFQKFYSDRLLEEVV